MIKRIIIDAGHGPNNTKQGVYDPGVVSAFGRESDLVENVVETTLAAFRDSFPEVVRTPIAASLSEVIGWCNTQYELGDFLIALHMNSGGKSSTGVEVYYAEHAPEERIKQAQTLGATFADYANLPLRAILPDTQSARGRLGFLRETKAPALLIELGFETNAKDVGRVKAKGASAFGMAIRALAGEA